eukprot:8842362-Prorocentrum_lima.AAC.1
MDEQTLRAEGKKGAGKLIAKSMQQASLYRNCHTGPFLSPPLKDTDQRYFPVQQWLGGAAHAASAPGVPLLHDSPFRLH